MRLTILQNKNTMDRSLVDEHLRSAPEVKSRLKNLTVCLQKLPSPQKTGRKCMYNCIAIWTYPVLLHKKGLQSEGTNK